MPYERGIFTISLDFELYWGVRDKRGVDDYKENLDGVEDVVSNVLRLFNDSGIHATWAVVGFLFFDDVEQLKKNVPVNKPRYKNTNLSPYVYIDRSMDLEKKYHFSPELIDLIRRTDGQEVGTHTFSHYFCLERGQSRKEFAEDISFAIEVARRNGICVHSLVFPRNQINPDYISVLSELGIQCYRGTESGFIYGAYNDGMSGKLRRALRLIDTYVNISGYHTYDLELCTAGTPYNFPSSRFLRPYSSKFAVLEGLKLKRITAAMGHAAANRRMFHLWWHPHNFGAHTEQNLKFLTKIIGHYELLRHRHGMRSLNMGELCMLKGKGNG